MYNLMVYLHVLATLAFLFSHGVTSIVAWRLRGQRDPATARAWLELYSTGGYALLFYISLLILLVCGVVAGFMGRWWGQGWIWASLALLLGIMIAMFYLGTRYYGRLRRALGMPYFDGRREHPAGDQAPIQEIEALLVQSPALALTLIGFGGIALILWLMMFKPF